MKRRKLKGLTLIELIVAMAVFGILMAGIMNMTKPVTEGANESKVLNYQKTNEETVVTYIGEQLRYANNILIAEKGAEFVLGPSGAASVTNNGGGGTIAYTGTVDVKGTNYDFGKKYINSPADAFNAFTMGMGIKHPALKDAGGEPVMMKPRSSDCGQFIHMIVWDGESHTYDGSYTGRMFGIKNGTDGTTKMSNGVANVTSNDFTAAVKNGYMYNLFGSGYFGNSDLNLSMSIDEEGILFVKCWSEYHAYKNSPKMTSTAQNPTVGSYQIRNFWKNWTVDGGTGDYVHSSETNDHVVMMVKDGHEGNGVEQPVTTGNIYYIVYTTDSDIDNIMNYGYRTGDTTSLSWKYHDYTTLTNGLDSVSGKIPLLEYYFNHQHSYAGYTQNFVPADSYKNGCKVPEEEST